MRARSSFTLLAAGTALLAPAAAANAAPTYPSISKIAPMQVAIGQTMVISGKNFRGGAHRNTVVFKRDGKRAIFVRVPRATKTRLTFIVPEKLRPFVSTKNVEGSKFRIRVLTKRFGKRYTSLKASPRILLAPKAALGPDGKPLGPLAGPPAPPPPPSNCDGDGQIDAVDADDDNDLLPDAEEISLKTDLCLRDTDGDGSWDVWEYESAIDQNGRASLPYPGKRPYPNPLFPDQNVDYDGDGMLGWQEHEMWQRFGNTGSRVDLFYSDGTQTSDLASGLTDDVRDVDADGIGNWREANGPGQRGWWKEMYTEEADYAVVYGSLDFLDRDTDGDGLDDGPDDVDRDGWTNAQEAGRGSIWTQMYNPCLPNPESSKCSLHPPLPIESSYPPFDKLGFPVPLSAGRPLPYPPGS